MAEKKVEQRASKNTSPGTTAVSGSGAKKMKIIDAGGGGCKKLPADLVKEIMQIMPLPSMKKVKVVKTGSKGDQVEVTEAKDVKLCLKAATAPRKSFHDDTVSAATATQADPATATATGVGGDVNKSGDRYSYDGVQLDGRTGKDPQKLKKTMRRISIAIGTIVTIILILVVLLVALMVGASSSRKQLGGTQDQSNNVSTNLIPDADSDSAISYAVDDDATAVATEERRRRKRRDLFLKGRRTNSNVTYFDPLDARE